MVGSTCSDGELAELLGGLEVSGLKSTARSLLCPPGLERDAQNLREGLALEVRYPHMARFTCDQCRDWWFNPIEGPQTLARGQGDQPIRRPDRNDVLCEGPRGCPRGHFSDPISLSEKNRQAWIHFQECDATGVFPDDPMVAHNTNIIRDVLSRRS